MRTKVQFGEKGTHMNHAKNLLLITFDQCRGDWIDPQKTKVELPCITRIAKSGIYFSKCYTTSPQCVPARLSWLTGLYPSQFNITQNAAVNIPDDAPSMIRKMRDKGWHTAIVGKTHWTSHQESGYDLRNNIDLLNRLGFEDAVEIAGPRAMQIIKCEIRDDWEKAGVLEEHLNDLKLRYQNGRTEKAWEVRPSKLPQELYPDIWITNKAVEKIDAMPTHKPWILWVSFVGPHEPFDTPLPWHNKNKDIKLPKALNRHDWIKKLNADCEMRKVADSWSGKLTVDAIKNLRIDYADHLQLLDDQVNRLVKAVNKREDNNKTSVAITADHGEMLGDYSMLYKSTFLEPSIKVPMIYLENITNHNSHGKEVKRSVSLTNILKDILTICAKKNASENLLKYTNKVKHICIEFREEMLVISDGLKLCVNKTGQFLWCSKQEVQSEDVNILRESNNLIEKIKLAKAKHIARKELTKRAKENWIWRDLSTKNTK